MSVPIVRVIRTNDDGTKDQVFPQTHVNAIFGLADALNNKELSVGVKSINGRTGDVKIEVLTEEDFQKIMRLIQEYESGNLGSGGSSGNIDNSVLNSLKQEFEAYKTEMLTVKDSLLKLTDRVDVLEKNQSTGGGSSSSTGLVTQSDYDKLKKIMSDYDSGKLGTGINNIIFEKIGEV